MRDLFFFFNFCEKWWNGWLQKCLKPPPPLHTHTHILIIAHDPKWNPKCIVPISKKIRSAKGTDNAEIGFSFPFWKLSCYIFNLSLKLLIPRTSYTLLITLLNRSCCTTCGNKKFHVLHEQSYYPLKLNSQ